VQAYLADLDENYYKANDANCVYYGEGANQYHRNPTWDETKAGAEWAWYYWNYPNEELDPPYQYFTHDHDVAGSGRNYVGEVYRAGKYISAMDTNYNYYELSAHLRRAYGTVRWANYQHTNIPSTFTVYYKNATNYFYDYYEPYKTVIATNQFCNFPREWDVDVSWSFQETIIPNVATYQKLDDSFISHAGIYEQVVFGSDEFPPLVYAGSIPPFCNEPVSGSSYYNNEGSVFKEKGMRLDYVNISGIRKFQFTYCTHRFW